MRIIFHWRTLIGSGNTDVRGKAQIFFIILVDYKQAVASFAGAWIETFCLAQRRYGATVAPFAGAWIQTLRSLWRCVRPFVAPFAGVWIETLFYRKPPIVCRVASFAGAWKINQPLRH